MPPPIDSGDGGSTRDGATDGKLDLANADTTSSSIDSSASDRRPDSDAMVVDMIGSERAPDGSADVLDRGEIGADEHSEIDAHFEADTAVDASIDARVPGDGGIGSDGEGRPDIEDAGTSVRDDADGTTRSDGGIDAPSIDAPADAASERGEDCDVQVGGNCQCLNGQMRSCGQCNAGTETCSNGAWGTCTDVLIVTPSRGPRMLCVPGNTFSMGSNDVTLPDDSRPVHSVTLPAFWMDETEVTSAQYEQCAIAGACAAALSGSGCNFGVAGRGNYPTNCLDLTSANAFCIWAGKRLPIEEEWEYAARGTDGRAYPWGNAAPGALANWNNLVVDGTQPVGSYPNGRSPFGLFDMAGNVWEWTSSQWCPYPASGITPPCGSQPIIYRGGGFNDADVTALNSGRRYYDVPAFWAANLGVRCAKSL